MSDIEHSIDETVNVLQPLFAKPKLTNTLLAKPPFRFIHDIVTATLNATGFPLGYFTPEELDSSNFKESKTAKLAFLDKLIQLVTAGNGSAIEVSSIKIVSGLEPANTNLLLTAFGRIALDQETDRNALIQRCLCELDATKDLPKRNQLDALDAVSIPSKKQDNSTRGDGSREVTGADGERVVMEHVSGCNEDIEQTRNMISKIISKPKCTDTLLNKPPFRFIHDIIIAVAKATQFDLFLIFSEAEQASSNVTEKQSKLQFLEKLINFIAKQISTPIDVNPTKIISGLEPGRTRYLLQLFTVVATTKVGTRDFVNSVHSQNEPVPASLGDGDGMNAFELEKLHVDLESKILHGGSVKASSRADPNMRPATANGIRWQVKPGKTDALIEPGVDGGEAVGKVQDVFPSTLHSMSAKDWDGEVDASVKTSSLGGLFSSLSSNTNTRPATANGTRPTKAGKTTTIPTEHEEILPDAILPNLHPKFAVETRMDDSSLHQNQRTTSTIAPPKLSGIDFISLASAVRHIAESTSSMGKYIDAVQYDLERLGNERNHWIDEQS